MNGNIVEKSFSVNLLVMRVFGYYPPNKNQNLYKVFAYLMYFILVVVLNTAGVVFLIFEDNIDIMQRLNNASLLSEIGCYVTKLIPFIYNVEEIKRCIHYFESPLFKITSIKHLDILEDCNKTCQKVNKIFLFFVAGSVISWGLKPLFFKEARLPVDIWLPFDATASALIFYTVYIILVLGVAFNAFSSAAIDPLIAGLAYHARGQIRILKDKLQYLNVYTNEEIARMQSKFGERTWSKSKIMCRRIKHCVDHHDAILEFIKLYENNFSVSVFSQFMASILVICITCLQLSWVEPLSFNFISLVIYLTTMFCEIFLFCYYGSLLIDESNSIVEAIYMGDWYEYDVDVRKMLLIIMEKSKRPMIVTAGKILDLSLVTFTNIIRRSYSLLAVLKNY